MISFIIDMLKYRKEKSNATKYIDLQYIYFRVLTFDINNLFAGLGDISMF